MPCESQQRTAAAQAAGKFKDEIVPLTVKMKKIDKATGAESMVDVDGRSRRMQPPRHDAGRPGGAQAGASWAASRSREGKYVTAGNASQFSDGASACVVMSAELAAKKNLKPLGIFRALRWPASSRTKWASARPWRCRAF